MNDDDLDPGDDQYGVERDTVAATPPRAGAQEETISMDDLGPAVMKLLGDMEILTEHVNEIDAALQAQAATAVAARDAPAEWALFDVPDRDEHPVLTLQLWVDFYNATYVSTTQSVGEDHNRAIPGCWLQHPGLAAEVATLAATWRAAFVGPTADPANAQNFHDRWRPGFAQRLRTWAPCSTERHTTNANGSPQRPTRFDR